MCDAQSELSATHFCHSSTCHPLNERHFYSVSERYRVLVSLTDSARAFACFSSFSPSECRRNTLKQANVPSFTLHSSLFLFFLCSVLDILRYTEITEIYRDIMRYTEIFAASLNKPQIKRGTTHRACAYCPTLHITLCVLPHTAHNIVHTNVNLHCDQFRLPYYYTLPLAVFKT